jgi:hypothetical protein
VAVFPESYIEFGYEQHCLGTPNSGRAHARRAHASRSCPRSWMSPSVGSILGEQGQQPADQCRLYTRLHRTGAQSTWRNSVFDTDARSPIALIEFHYLPLIGNLPPSDNSIHNYQESFDGRTVEQTRSIDIRTLQQTRAKAAPHVFRLPIAQKICYKVSTTTLEHSVQCQRLIIPAGNASLRLLLRA